MNDIPRAQWGSYLNYILVTTGAVVGLGNIFNFPLLVAKFGGLFVLFYVLSEVLLSIPLLLAELLIGRRGKQNPVGAISLMAMESKASISWRYMGWLCFTILFLTLSYYTVRVAFPLGYLVETARQFFSNGTFISMDKTELVSNFFSLEICFIAFLVITLLVIMRGINRGLELISLITVPTYFVILLALAIYVSSQGDFVASVNYLFHLPVDQPIWPIIFAALTFAFFKLNVGMGSMIVYGSYLPYSVPLIQSTIIIVCLDAIASLLSYFIIGPLMLQSNLSGDSFILTYSNLIAMFSHVPYSLFCATLFFFAAVVAAWTPTIAMAESAVLTVIERFQMSRLAGTLIVGIGALLVGTGLVLSITNWSSILLFSTWTIDGFIQNFASDLATPASAFLIAIFCGWIVKREITFEELEFKPSTFTLWRGILRYLAPICIAVIFIGIGFN